MNLFFRVCIIVLMLTVAAVPLRVYSQSPSCIQALDSIPFITEMPYICEGIQGIGCGDKTYWNLVRCREEIIPYLIERLDDTTSTQAFVPNFGGYFTTADVVYMALEELIKGIPTFKLLGVRFDKRGCGYCAYWNHLRHDIKHRRRFKAAVARWYEKNKSDLIWVVSEEFQTCDCSFKHPNGGHFELRTQNRQIH